MERYICRSQNSKLQWASVMCLLAYDVCVCVCMSAIDFCRYITRCPHWHRCLSKQFPLNGSNSAVTFISNESEEVVVGTEATAASLVLPPFLFTCIKYKIVHVLYPFVSLFRCACMHKRAFNSPLIIIIMMERMRVKCLSHSLRAEAFLRRKINIPNTEPQVCVCVCVCLCAKRTE